MSEKTKESLKIVSQEKIGTDIYSLWLQADHMAENSMQDLMKIEALHQNRIPLVYPSQPFRTIVKDQSVRTHYFRIRIWHKKQTAECHVQKTHLQIQCTS